MSAPSLSRAKPRSFSFDDDSLQPIVIEALAQFVVEPDINPLVDASNILLACGRNFCHSARFSGSSACSLAVSSNTARSMSACCEHSSASCGSPSTAAILPRSSSHFSASSRRLIPQVSSQLLEPFVFRIGSLFRFRSFQLRSLVAQ